MAHSAGVRLALVVALAGSLASAAFGFNVSFSVKPASSDRTGGSHADFNGDGREDYASINFTTGQFRVFLSNGDGTYAAPATYTIPGGADATLLVIVDFDSDGKADLVVGGSDNQLHLFVNNGSGRFSQKAVIPHWVGVEQYAAAVGDFNHDGHLDLAFLSNNFPEQKVIVWFGNAKSGFTPGPTSPLPTGESCDYHIYIGDFDGDGRADLLCEAMENPDASVLYGDGKGHFPQHAVILGTTKFEGFILADVDGDGKMDVIKVANNPAAKNISVAYGSATRKWTRTANIPTLHATGWVAAADINGDGINDLIVDESAGIASSVTYYVNVLIRNSDGSYQKEQTLISGNSGVSFQGEVIRANRDTKPDIALSKFVLLNTTPGNFPPCAAPNAFDGINVCSPAAGATVASPISFKVGAAGPVLMRDVEVWIDGKKLGGQIDGFSNYTFLNRSANLSAGTHTVGIVAAGWDQSLERKTFTLKVK